MCMSPRCGNSEIEVTGPGNFNGNPRSTICGADFQTSTRIDAILDMIEAMLARVESSHQMLKDPGIPSERHAEVVTRGLMR